jgi:hypothetical protein
MSFSVPFATPARSDQALDLTDARRQQLGRDERAGVELDHQPLHLVLQLAHVAGPVVGHHELHRLLREAAHGLAQLGRVARKKCAASTGMSSRRSRSGGLRSGKTLSR